jgi:hypothetical protein
MANRGENSLIKANGTVFHQVGMVSVHVLSLAFAEQLCTIHVTDKGES